MIFFLIFAQNIDCGYKLEPPRRGGSNKYPQSMFWGKNKKSRYTPALPQFYYVKVGFKGVYFSWTCFPNVSPCCFQSDVVRSKNTECLSFPLIFANLVIAILWTTYGRLIADVYVAVSIPLLKA